MNQTQDKSQNQTVEAPETAEQKQQIFDMVEGCVNEVKDGFPDIPDEVKERVHDDDTDIDDQEAFKAFEKRLEGMVETGDLEELHRYNQKAFQDVVGPYLRRQMDNLGDIVPENIATKGIKNIHDLNIAGGAGYYAGKGTTAVAGMTVGLAVALIMGILKAGMTWAGENASPKQGILAFFAAMQDGAEAAKEYTPADSVGKGVEATFATLSGLARPGEDEATVQSMFEQAAPHELAELYLEVGGDVLGMSEAQFNDLCEALKEHGLTRPILNQALNAYQNSESEKTDDEIKRMHELAKRF